MPALLETENDSLVSVRADQKGGRMLVCVSACFFCISVRVNLIVLVYLSPISRHRASAWCR